MSDYPRTVVELRDWFASETACREYLQRLRWPDGVHCPDCASMKIWPMKPPFYRCSQCGYDFTVTAGTLFADTHKPLRLWFEAIWYVTKSWEPALWACSGCWVWAVIGRLGTGCTSCAGQWFDRAEIVWPGWCKSMRPSSAGHSLASAGAVPLARGWY